MGRFKARAPEARYPARTLVRVRQHAFQIAGSWVPVESYPAKVIRDDGNSVLLWRTDAMKKYCNVDPYYLKLAVSQPFLSNTQLQEARKRFQTLTRR